MHKVGWLRGGEGLDGAAWREGHICALGDEANPARGRDERVRGGTREEGKGDSKGRWAHASPRAGEAHALGARGGRAHRATRVGVGVCATARAERVGCVVKTDLRNQG